MVDLDLVKAVKDLAVVFERRNVRHALIGGLAVGMHSRPRSTKGADFILNVLVLSFPGLLDDLIAGGFEIDQLPTIRRWSTERLIVFYRGRVRIDWMQPVLPVYTTVMESAQNRMWEGRTIRVATTEGLILTKLISFRSQDRVDMESLIASNPRIDFDWIRQEWSLVETGDTTRSAWLDLAIANRTS
jgi:hypothetical protein